MYKLIEKRTIRVDLPDQSIVDTHIPIDVYLIDGCEVVSVHIEASQSVALYREMTAIIDRFNKTQKPEFRI